MLLPSTPNQSYSLPTELLDAIFFYVELRADLRALCLTSVIFLPVAQRYLYRSVNLRWDHHLKAIKACHVIMRNPVLAGFVRSFKFFLDENQMRGEIPNIVAEPLPTPPVLAPGVTRLIFRALKSMTRLEALSLPSQCLLWGQSDANLAQLDFTLRSLELDGPILQDIAILERQPHIVDLSIPFRRIDRLLLEKLRKLPRAVCSDLRQLKACLEIAEELVPYRRVRIVRIKGTLDRAQLRGLSVRLALSSVPLLSISFKTLALNEDDIADLAMKLPGLQEIELLCFRVTPEQTLAVLQKAMFRTALSLLLSLTRVEVCLTHRAWPQKGEEEHEGILCALQDVCPTLRVVRLSVAVSPGTGILMSYTSREASSESSMPGEENGQRWKRSVKSVTEEDIWYT